ncbi:MAG: EAL domain-containing protein [Devosia sp.]
MGEGAGQAGAMVAGNALLHAALASMPYGFTIWNEQMRLMVWNDAYLEMYHLPRDKVRADMTLPEMAEVSAGTGDHGGMAVEDVHTLYLERFKHDGVKVVEHHVGDRTIRTTNTKMPGIGWVVAHQDITEEVEQRRIAAARENALARQNMRFDAAVNNMPQGLAMFGPDQRLVICNDMFASMYGLSRDFAVSGISLTGILEYRRRKGLITEAQLEEGYLNLRFEVARERGHAVSFVEQEQDRIISVTHQPMPDGGWVSIHQDITAQRAKEDLIQARTLELEIQNVRFDAAINNMSHGLTMFDADARLIVCNRQYAEIYSLTAEQLRAGTSFWDMLANGAEDIAALPPAERQTREDLMRSVIEGGRPFREHIKLPNGRVIAAVHHPMAGWGWLATHEDITEQHQHHETIRHLARHDALTDLPNRMLFQEEMAKLDARLKRREKLAVVCVDLDHFKAVNDTLGHAIGDEVLVRSAQRLREAARETDFVARLGGDEFAVIIGPLEDPRHAGLVADRIVRSLGQPMLVEGRQIIIGASAGIALAPIDGRDSETLLRNADLALYRAKSQGRGTYHFFEQGMDDALKERRVLELGLRNAMAKGELRLVYQPVVGLGDSKISALEALLRWDHPERGPIPPSEFIPVAEETGLIVAIGEWVMDEACRAAARWPDSVGISVNLSAMQFRHRGLVDSVERALKAAGLAPARLELEITESLLAADSEATLRVLHRLRAMGVRIAIDDFGTGYSSLGYLRSFPFDKIKIDRSFMNQLAGDEDSMAVVNAMIGLGRSLGMATTAEGIETETQLESVKRHGCDEVQGFLFSAPLPASGIDALLGAPPELAALSFRTA